jgi:hypothetical protein
MGALAFWKAVVSDRSNFLERIIAMLEENGIRYCVIGGVGVNAYAEPIVTLDLDVVVAADQLDRVRELAAAAFKTREFPHSFIVYDPDSKLQVQIQLRPELGSLVDRARVQDVMDLRLPVAAPDDLLRAKIEAAIEPTRRPSKRQKDLADIARLVEAFPELRDLVPPEVRDRLVS